MRRRLAALGAALAAGVLLTPAGALADGDPASDVLLGQNVFYPYKTPSVPASLMKSLNGATAAAAKAHFPIKVALISGPLDLGVVPRCTASRRTTPTSSTRRSASRDRRCCWS